MLYDCLDVPFEVIELKDVQKGEGGEEGIFAGYGSTFGGKPDFVGDVVDRGAFVNTIAKGGKFGIGIKMLWQHDHSEIPGVWINLAENDRGLQVEGELLLDTVLGKETRSRLRAKAIGGLSIGYELMKDNKGNALPDSFEEIGGKRHLKNLDLWEVSLVTFPANPRAGVLRIKEATNARSMEKVLRDVGLSRTEAKYVVSLCKFPTNEDQRDADVELEEKDVDVARLEAVLSGIKYINTEMDIFREVIHAR